MGEMTKEQALALLREANPRAQAGDLHIYVDAWAEYRAAQAKIDEGGTVVLHPRTGAPFANPYIPVRDKAGAVMSRLRIKADALWPEPVAPRRRR